MKKVMLVFGTRPEAVKLCPLVMELRKRPDEFRTVVCVTAQHREMLDQVLNIFNVKTDYDLNLMKNNQSLFDITSNCLTGIGKIINKEEPDIVLVQGDTTTTFAGSLAAYYNKIRVGHVEAGLRTYDKYSPFPEEINRRLVGVIADIHFAPTDRNKRNLLLEGVPAERIVVTGNTVIDALLWVRERIHSTEKAYSELGTVDFRKRIILVTGHRRENFGLGFIEICSALKELAEANRDVELVYPVHLNPNVLGPVRKVLCGVPNIKLIKPLHYEPFIYLMDKCHFIISDSGGIQEEAPSLGKPVLLTRNATERPEAVEVNAVKIVGTTKRKIIEEANKLLKDPKYYAEMSNAKNPYGDGYACKRIIENLWQNDWQ